MLLLQHVNFDLLEKGSIIPVSVCEQVINCKRSDRMYSRKLLPLAGAIAGHFKKNDIIVTVITRNDSIVILTDEEASKYNQRRFKVQLKGAKRAHYRTRGVDHSGFSYEDMERHQRDLEQQATVLTAIRLSQKIYELQPTVRNVPKA